MSSGSAQPQLPIKDLNTMLVPKINLINQQHIVDITKRTKPNIYI